jgi:hypothetical protein
VADLDRLLTRIDKRVAAAQTDLRVGGRAAEWDFKLNAPPDRAEAMEQLIKAGRDATRVATDLMRQAAPALADSYDRHFVGLASKAFDKWPVRTGYSKASIDVTLTQTSPTEVTGALRVRAPYAGYIRWRGSQRYGEVLRQLILEPSDAAVDAMLRDAADDLDLG